MSIERVNAAYYAALDSLSLEDIEAAIAEVEATRMISSEQSGAMSLCAQALRRRRHDGDERVKRLRERLRALL